MIDTLDAYRHEVLDRTHTVQIMLDQLLEGHPFITSFPGLMDKVVRIQDDLASLYQDIGNVKFEEIKIYD